MKVVITGGGGYLGEKLCKALIQRGSLVDRLGRAAHVRSIVLVGRSFSEEHGEPQVVDGITIEKSRGSVADRAYLDNVIKGDDVTVFHLAAVLTGVTERDLKSAIDINVNGTRNVLDALAACGEGSRIVMTSSVTVFGRQINDEPISDRSAIQPGTVYGHTKAIGELLLSAYTRAGKVDGRCGRLATVVVRPHKIGSSAGASISDALRDITLGRSCDVVLKPSTRAAVIGYDRCIEGLMLLQTLNKDKFGGDATVNFPALTVSIEEMIEAASASARRHGRSPGAIRYVPDNFAQSVIDGWATTIDGTRARGLGINCETNLAEICDRVGTS